MPGAIPVLSQAAEDLALEWTDGDDLNFAWYVIDVDWSGVYTATMFDQPGGLMLLTFTVAATYEPLAAEGPRTLFEMSNVDSTAVRSNGWWTLVDTGLNVTRFCGPVTVRA